MSIRISARQARHRQPRRRILLRRREGMAMVGLVTAAAYFMAACVDPSLGSDRRIPVAEEHEDISVNVSANQLGRVTSSGNGDSRTFHEYDALGREVHIQHVMDGASYLSGKTYGYPQNPTTTTGPGSVVTSTTFPDGEVVRYTYDAGGASQSVTAQTASGPTETIISGVVRNARGESVQVSYGDGTTTVHCYNDGATCNGAATPATDLRLNRIKTTAGATVLQDYGYQFDARGNVARVDDNVTPALSATYQYDSRSQLTGMARTDGTALAAFAYDGIGNLVTMHGQAQVYDRSTGGGPHAVARSAKTGRTYYYDANGNLTRTAVTASGATDLALTWTPRNMVAQVTRGGTVIEKNNYVGEVRWKKQEAGSVTYYLPAMRVEDGAFRKFFGSFAERSPDGRLRFYHNDHLGSAALITDGTSCVVERRAYWPYGEDRQVTDGPCGGGFTPRYTFTFKEKDSSGLFDFGARSYDPATGRFVSADSQGDGPNRYAYAANNPLKYSDPTGHFAWLVFWAVFSAVVAVVSQVSFMVSLNLAANNSQMPGWAKAILGGLDVVSGFVSGYQSGFFGITKSLGGALNVGWGEALGRIPGWYGFATGQFLGGLPTAFGGDGGAPAGDGQGATPVVSLTPGAPTSQSLGPPPPPEIVEVDPIGPGTVTIKIVEWKPIKPGYVATGTSRQVPISTPHAAVRTQTGGRQATVVDAARVEGQNAAGKAESGTTNFAAHFARDSAETAEIIEFGTQALKAVGGPDLEPWKAGSAAIALHGDVANAYLGKTDDLILNAPGQGMLAYELLSGAELPPPVWLAYGYLKFEVKISVMIYGESYDGILAIAKLGSLAPQPKVDRGVWDGVDSHGLNYNTSTKMWEPRH